MIPPFRSALEEYLRTFDGMDEQAAALLPELMQVGVSPPFLAVLGNPIERTTQEVVATCHSFMRRDSKEIWLIGCSLFDAASILTTGNLVLFPMWNTPARPAIAIYDATEPLVVSDITGASDVEVGRNAANDAARIANVDVLPLKLRNGDVLAWRTTSSGAGDLLALTKYWLGVRGARPPGVA